MVITNHMIDPPEPNTYLYTKEELLKLLDDAYWKGYRDGSKTIYTTVTTTDYPWLTIKPEWHSSTTSSPKEWSTEWL